MLIFCYNNNMKNYMNEALECAKKAYAMNEVPIGCVIVYEGEIIARGYNTRECSNDITAHAEINAIKEAAKYLQTWKLEECELYVTIKPCLMCYSAIEQSRIKKVYFGANQYEYKGKAFDTLIKTPKMQMIGPILEEPCMQIMKSFFERMRNGTYKD